MTDMDNKMFNNREELCETLDRMVLEFFDTLTDLYTQQALLAETMKSGFLNLSRARYNMGVKAVNIHQIDEAKMQAHYRVGVADTENIDCGSDIFSIITSAEIDSQTEDKEKNVDKSGLRRRTVKSEERVEKAEGEDEIIKERIEEVESMSEALSISNGEQEEKKLFDPIKWFGVLVPGSLKQSQNEFKKSIELTVNIGNLQTRLENLRKNYRKLLQLKKNKFSEKEM